MRRLISVLVLLAVLWSLSGVAAAEPGKAQPNERALDNPGHHYGFASDASSGEVGTDRHAGDHDVD